MSGILKGFSVFIIVLLCSYSANAQSEAAYLRAGDEAMRRKDPVAATSFYENVLEYSSKTSTKLKIAAAWKARFNYTTAINWYLQCISDENSTTAEQDVAYTQLYDLTKRSEQGDRSKSYLLLLKDSTLKDSLQIDFNLFKHLPKVEAEIILLPQQVNSANSDFAPVMIGDSVLLFSSNRFVNAKTGKTSSKILFSKKISDKYSSANVMKGGMNLPEKHTANASVSEDGKLMVFTICKEDEDNKIICELYESHFGTKGWETAIRLNDSINISGFTSTQPCIRTNREKGYLLYYTSDRTIGAGAMDLWYCERDAEGNYSPPRNLNFLNTHADEITPFYDGYTGTLYFSSNRIGGAGAYDIWQWQSKDSLVKNSGTPINSGYDDLYFRSLPPSKKTTLITQANLVSNRPPSRKFNGEACCYDIFKVESILPKEIIDIVIDSGINTDPLITDTAAYIHTIDASLRLLLPLRLYFDNDYPDPKSRKSSTSAQYTVLATNYLLRQGVFLENVTSAQQKGELMSFFRDSVQGGLGRLEQFSEGITELLNLGYSIEITLQGSASPLADSHYNVILSERRIASLLNDWLADGSELLRKAIASGKIKITRDAAGERLSGKMVADKVDNADAIYSLNASLLRRIEITAITLRKP